MYIQNLIQREGALVPITEEPKIGQMLAAPFFEEGLVMYYRARIKSKISKDKVEVLISFVDCFHIEKKYCVLFNI